MPNDNWIPKLSGTWKYTPQTEDTPPFYYFETAFFYIDISRLSKDKWEVFLNTLGGEKSRTVGIFKTLRAAKSAGLNAAALVYADQLRFLRKADGVVI
jgi:hypothetical protein